MPTYAIINNGIVTNMARADAPLGENWVEATEGARRGDTYADGVFSRPEPAPEPVPAIISRRQFAVQLVVEGLATEAEALAYLRAGTLPSALATLLAGIPAEAQFAAEALLISATEFERDHPFAAQIAELQGWTDADVDDFFRAAGAL